MAEREQMTVNELTVEGPIIREDQTIFIPAALGKVGATAGFVTGGTDTAMVTCPASQTASTFVIPVSGLKAGMTISGFHLVGQVESAGNTATVNAALKKITAAAAGSTHATVDSMTQVSCTADTALSSSNAVKTGLSEVVADGETFYVLVTVTTAASTDVELNSIAITVDEV